MQSDGALEELLKRDPRYPAEAYHFVMDALAYTVKKIGKRRHVTGKELLYGIRDLAQDAWGLMSLHVLNSWGIQATDDFGEIVFNMVNAGLLSKTETDSKDDFKGVYRFQETFGRPAAPKLDEHGHIHRKLPHIQPGEKISWISLFGASGLN